ncbi:MAG: hypothetical protein GY927_02830 [bacterium]|nr:hypothetical protein [bacterium]
MKKLFKAALVIATFAGFQLMAVTGASAADTGLLKYAQDPGAKQIMSFKPFKVAGWRGRRNRRIARGALFAGVTALIISEAIRSKRRSRYNDDYYYGRSYRYRSSYPGRRQCRKWNRRCDYGNYRACRKWNRRCR